MKPTVTAVLSLAEHLRLTCSIQASLQRNAHVSSSCATENYRHTDENTHAELKQQGEADTADGRSKDTCRSLTAWCVYGMSLHLQLRAGITDRWLLHLRSALLQLLLAVALLLLLLLLQSRLT
jgi:hypothetical protein